MHDHTMPPPFNMSPSKRGTLKTQEKTEYIVVESRQLKSFEEYVSSRLESGWELHGNMIISKGLFYQAMTRKYHG